MFSNIKTWFILSENGLEWKMFNKTRFMFYDMYERDIREIEIDFNLTEKLCNINCKRYWR